MSHTSGNASYNPEAQISVSGLSKDSCRVFAGLLGHLSNNTVGLYHLEEGADPNTRHFGMRCGKDVTFGVPLRSDGKLARSALEDIDSNQRITTIFQISEKDTHAPLSHGGSASYGQTFVRSQPDTGLEQIHNLGELEIVTGVSPRDGRLKVSLATESNTRGVAPDFLLLQLHTKPRATL